MRCATAIWFLVMLPATVAAVVDEDLIGTWDWEMTTKGFGGIDTPESVGYEQTLVFADDGTYEWYRDETLHQSGSWELRDQSSSCGTPQSLWMDGLPGGSAVRIDEDRLVFGAGCVDAFDYYFTRRTVVPTSTTTWGSLKRNAQASND